MKDILFNLVDEQKNELVDIAFDIFDHPECDGKEYYACELLTKKLKELGFEVESGVGGMETAFRAVWKKGEGGPNIGLLGEYDALPDVGHACGHHLQTPAAIGAAMALRKLFENSDTPFTLTIYGTPAEETTGGKITMIENGCFRDVDVTIATHATKGDAGLSARGLALVRYDVEFKGKRAHAAGAPFEGRSAADAMFLSFNGIEFLREHVKDGTRMHYAVCQSTKPSNVVPATAFATYTLRSKENSYLGEIEERFLNVINGACMMTGTTCEITRFPAYMSAIPNEPLGRAAVNNLKLLSFPAINEEFRDGKGSTDFGNVSLVVPSVLVRVFYSMDHAAHSLGWLESGKSEDAVNCLLNSAKVVAGIGYDLITDPELVKKAKEEFDKAEK